MKEHIGSALLLAMLLAQPFTTVAQESFEFGDFELPVPPGQGSDFGSVFPIPQHGAFFVNQAFAGEMLMDPMHVVMLAEHVDLSKEQRETLGRIVDEAMPKMRDLLFRMGDARKELDTALEGEGKDETALRALADAQGKLHADLMFLQLSTRQRMRKLLSAEQRASLDEGMFGWQGAPAMHKMLHDKRKPK